MSGRDPMIRFVCLVVLASALAGCQKTTGQAGVAPGATSPTAPAKPEEPAARTGQPVTIGDVRVTLLSAREGDVLVGKSKAESVKADDLSLTLRLRIENLSGTKVLTYGHSWRRILAADRPSLRDEFGNEYFVGLESPLVGVEGDPEIYPGKGMVEVLVGKKPVDKAARFTLSLPTIGTDKTSERFRFQFARADLGR